MINAEVLADELYTVYCEAVGGKAFNGDPLPDWKEFRAGPNKLKQSDAWVVTAKRAMDLLYDYHTTSGAGTKSDENNLLHR